MWAKRVFPALSLALSIAILWACAGEVRGEASGPMRYSTRRVTHERISEEIPTSGNISFMEKVAVSSKVEGRVRRIHRRVGDRVLAGELLAEMERLSVELELRKVKAELTQAEAAVRLAEARLDEARRRADSAGISIQKARGTVESRAVSLWNLGRKFTNQLILLSQGGATRDQVENLRVEKRQAELEEQQARRDLELLSQGYRDEDLAEAGWPLPKDGASRRESFRRFNTRVEEAEAEVSRAALKAARLREESILVLLEECQIRAPKSGILAARNFEEGEELTRSTPLFVLFETDPVHVVASVGERDYGKLRKGMGARVRVEALGETELRASLDLITPLLDLQTRSGEVRLLLGNPGGRLRPGMFARVVIETGFTNTVFRVPSSCLRSREKDLGALFLSSNGIALERRVRTGKENDGLTEILEGLSENDEVVLDGVEALRDGQKLDGP